MIAISDDAEMETILKKSDEKKEHIISPVPPTGMKKDSVILIMPFINFLVLGSSPNTGNSSYEAHRLF